ncbi:hypothetical protein KIP88_02405 [Bradyrhizobium sp. SRL28]|uniref:hypothetical protein n=1 Tax=Bradyrhizobium sp. SRL28 TaxID=2836178 RepID=UPI001BDE93E8|nr:hypothetical protein [Bradyrhizobium sp. SRL28]MBT1509341.1 hypothetical protein [Bradyrhizobium sp. SRL28]
MSTELTANEEFMLVWLSKEDFSQYGECHGATLDALIAKGLAQVHGEDTETNNTFIAKGHGIMFRAVSLTDSGHAVVLLIRERDS